jgi:hypothetical protein
MVEAIIRGWRCHIGWNNFTTLWKIVTAVRQHCSFYWLTIVSSTTQVSIPITEIDVYVVS